MIGDLDGGNRQQSLDIGVMEVMSGDGNCGGRSPMGRARAPAREAVPAQGSCAPGDETQDSWRLEPHICRACFSRLVSRPAPQHRVLDAPQPTGRLYHCTNCGLEAVAPGADALCCCGTKIRRPTKGSKSGMTLVDAQIRCAVNPTPTPDFPSVIIAMEVPITG